MSSKIDLILVENYMEKMMREYRKEGLRKLSSAVSHPNLIEDFAILMAHAWMESHPNAQIIAKELDLDKIDFLAIMGNLSGFEECLIRERELMCG